MEGRMWAMALSMSIVLSAVLVTINYTLHPGNRE